MERAYLSYAPETTTEQDSSVCTATTADPLAHAQIVVDVDDELARLVFLNETKSAQCGGVETSAMADGRAAQGGRQGGRTGDGTTTNREDDVAARRGARSRAAGRRLS